MERSYIAPDSFMKLQLLQDKQVEAHGHDFPELLYLLHGGVRLALGDKTFHLSAGDIVLINPHRSHGYHCCGEILLARFQISMERLRQLLNGTNAVFLCNSCQEHNAAYDGLREILDQLLNQTIREGECRLYWESLCYQAVSYLASHFLITPHDVRYETTQHADSRTDAILDYIRSKYRHTITLSELGEHLYLSPSYLSKYIKRHFKITFGELVTAVRLEHAKNGLLDSSASVRPSRPGQRVPQRCRF